MTQNCWFRVDTTIIGMTAIDSLKAMHHGLADSHRYKKIDVRCFAALLSKQFFRKAQVLPADVNAGTNIPLPRGARSVDTTIPDAIKDSGVSPSSTVTMDPPIMGKVLHPPPEAVAGGAPQASLIYCEAHKYVTVSNTARQTCTSKGCSTRTPNKCLTCNKFYCNGEGSRKPRWCLYH